MLEAGPWLKSQFVFKDAAVSEASSRELQRKKTTPERGRWVEGDQLTGTTYHHGQRLVKTPSYLVGRPKEWTTRAGTGERGEKGRTTADRCRNVQDNQEGLPS